MVFLRKRLFCYFQATVSLMQDKTPRIPIPAEVRRYVLERDRHRCVKCGSDRQLTVDHIIPLAKGGSNDLSNFQTLCRRCNSGKRDRFDGGSDRRFRL